MRRRVRALGRQALDALAASLVAGLLLAGTMTACTQEHDDAPAVGESEQRTPTTAPTATAPARLDLTVRVVRVSGGLGPARKKEVAARARRALEAYVRAAYLDGVGAGTGTDKGGTATRSTRQGGTAAGAFAAFTPDTARQARRDEDLLTSAGFGDVTKVEPVEATALLSVLAPKGRVVGATARTTLRFEVTDGDGNTHQQDVHGRLMLTQEQGRWRIFGYELAGDPASGPAR
jgi:hypothetical protein